MKNLAPQTEHGALVTGEHDDRARQDFAFSFRNFVTSELMPSNRVVFDRRASPAFAKASGAPPANPADIRAAMAADDYYTFYLSARRASQEMIWQSVIPAVETATTPARAEGVGMLELDPALAVPAYVDAIDIHCMPGGYAADRGDGDTAAGAVYDRGVHLYMSGLMGPLNDGVGRLAANWLRATEPGFAPRRILDMGCGVGHATLPWLDTWPEAEVYAIDVGAALLRYAHARAGALGKAVRWCQANAEHTPYPNGWFDLVTSTIVLHETSSRALPAILAETHRLLAPGGLMLHVDQPRFDDSDPYATFLQENETWYNNEPFWRTYRRIDLAEAAAGAGFARDAIRLGVLSADVVRQSQNNAPNDPAAARRGFSALLARKSPS